MSISDKNNLPTYSAIFNRRIKAHYPAQFEEIQVETANHFIALQNDIAFIHTSGNPMDKRMDFCAYFLALIKTLDRRQETYEQIRKICLEITIEYVQPKNKIQAYFKKTLPKLIDTRLGRIMVKLFAKKVGQNKSSEGFIAQIITDKNETFGLGYGVNILECGICKLFKKHNYAKYASILCEVDKITTQLAGLEMHRTGTIANGAKICDFRYKIIEVK